MSSWPVAFGLLRTHRAGAPSRRSRRAFGGDTKAQALARTPLFAGLTGGVVAALAVGTEDLDFAPGDVLCREGERAREFFVIAEGEVELTKAGERVCTLGSGDFFGELSLIERSPRRTTVTALTPLRAFVLSSHEFLNLVEASPEVERRVLRELVRENVYERHVAEEALRRQAELNAHQALHDPLTGLPNRALFRDRLEQAVLAVERNGGSVAALMVDLDRFKEINDTLGHDAGDALLREVGTRLQGALRASDTVARLGGDEFGIVFRDVDRATAARLVDKIVVALERPILVRGLPIGVEASFGVALYPEHGRDVDALLRHADVAMYRAKADSGTCAFYDRASDSHHPARLTLVGELRRAMERRELFLEYQPKAVLGDARVASVEALLRWAHPERGTLPPDEFVPLAQRTSLIRPLTVYVVDEALRQARAWHREGLELAVAVNVSARNLLDVGFPDDVRGLLDKWQLDARWLELELTESAMLADPVRTKGVLDRLGAMGVRLSVDDFGTGYSSFAYLKTLPVDEIKIDRCFVTRMLSDDDDAVIVRSTIDLGRNLGLDVVAEGVEDEETWRELHELGCDVAQGYFLSRPLAPDALAAWLRGREQPVTSS